MKTSHAASVSQRSLQSLQALRTRLLILPLAASVWCMGLAADLRAQPVQYIEQGQVYGHAQGHAQTAFTQQELDQMLAPIALYPDALLSQILMASTYPLEVVQAARWSRAHPGLSGDDAVRAAVHQDWDPSVKSMVAFPQILSMMDERLDWTQRLGDAFLDQEPHVMETVQTLRQRAYAAGNLNSDRQVRVVRQERIILVEPVNPQVVYVPYYDPTVIYGAWWWPAPPVYWRPWAGYAPAYVRPGVHVGFYWGGGVSISAGFFFGRPDWQRRSVNVVHVNNYYYNTAVVNRSGPARPQAGPGPWRHDPSHRRSIPYRDPAVRQQFAVQQRQAVEQRAQRRDETRRESQAEVRRAPQARDGRNSSRPEDNRRDDNRGERRDGRGDARPDRGTGPRSDAAPAFSPPAQRPDQAQAQQRRQAEEVQRQQQAQQRQAEPVQRQQPAERVQREQQRQAEPAQRQQQRPQQDARRDEPRRDARPAGGQRQDRGEERGEGRGRGEGRNRQSAS